MRTGWQSRYHGAANFLACVLDPKPLCCNGTWTDVGAYDLMLHWLMGVCLTFKPYDVMLAYHALHAGRGMAVTGTTLFRQVLGMTPGR